MKLSTRSRYGTRMLLDIALNGEEGPVRIKEISQRQGVSIKYLEKLIRPLKQAQFIKSKRGPKGGHMLNMSPDKITIGQLVRLFEDELSLTRCVKDPSVCPITQDCYTRRVWLEASQAMYEKLDSITLTDLLEDARRSGSPGTACFPARKDRQAS
jgi:Rrf2 family transcriptional regulator, iron-sulfur cluster assembly transcription factor